MKARETTMITLKISSAELELLTSLASDQLFRREFIDPKMPGHKNNAEETVLGKALVARLRTVLGHGSPAKTVPARMVG